MNFVRINWKLNDGTIASTDIPEIKAALTLEKLNEVTLAWLDRN